METADNRMNNIDNKVDNRDVEMTDLSTRKDKIVHRLHEISISIPTTTKSSPPQQPNLLNKKTKSKKKKKKQVEEDSNDNDEMKQKPIQVTDIMIPIVENVSKSNDTHWDYLLKEMQWLAVDFQVERKRHMSSRKRISTTIKNYHNNTKQREIKLLTKHEILRRKLAYKQSKEIQKNFWDKINRIITYKQKVLYDTSRNNDMNLQLIKLVQQTEKYTNSIINIQQCSGGGVTDNNDNVLEQQLTIEEALSTKQTRRSKQRIHDYARMLHDSQQDDEKNVKTIILDKTLYGESTEESGSDGSFILESDEVDDDESTMREAEIEELKERRQQQQQQQMMPKNENETTKTDQDQHIIDISFVADPKELQLLQEEADMDINLVLERFLHKNDDDDDDGDDKIATATNKKKVQFDPDVKQVMIESSYHILHDDPYKNNNIPDDLDPGHVADDDMDDSDVEDYNIHDENNGNNDGEDEEEEEEFVGKEEVDDETTMVEEEELPQEMSAKDEIELLQRENELPVEELRQQYNVTIKTEEAAFESITENIEKDGNNDEDPPVAQNQKQIHDDAMSQKQQNHDETRQKDTDDEEIEMLDKQNECERKGSTTTSLLPKLFEIEDDAEEEYEPDDEMMMVDDETTMEAEEKLGRDISYKDEIAMLKNEGEMDINQLRKLYNLDTENNELNNTESDDGDHINDKKSNNDDDANIRNDNLGQLLVQENLDDDAEEYNPDETVVVDDETTIEAEERLGRDMSYQDEIAMLKNESEMDIDELRKLYTGGTLTNTSDVDGSSTSDDDDDNIEEAEFEEDKCELTKLFVDANLDDDQENDDDFNPDDDEEMKDDETTIEAEERLGRDITAEEEINLLKKESEMPIEKLNSMYTMTENDEGNIITENKGRHDIVDYIRTRKRKHNNNEMDHSESKKKKSRHDGEDDDDDGEKALSKLEVAAEVAKKNIATRPFLIPGWVKLREYQQAGLNWLVSLQSRRLNGILADEMGLGKTLQTISLLAYLAAYKGIWGPHLIVVPTSVILNWETELKRFCPALKVLCYYGSAKRRKELRTGWTKPNWHHVVITSYQLAVQDSFAFKRKRWYYLVLDEAQHIKNFQSQRWQTLINFNTQRRLLLTGTPLQNSLMELWSLLHFLMPYIFRSRKEFSYWFANPMNSMIEGSTEKNDDVVKRLHGILRPFVLRRLKKDVETQLPGKYEHILKCQLSRRQMFIYEEFMARSSTRQALKKGGSFLSMMSVLMALRKVCNHPDLFEPRSIVTPFVVESIVLPMPSCIADMLGNHDPTQFISDFLLVPLWSGSQGLPCMSAALRHDDVESQELLELEASLDTPAISSFEYDDNDAPVCPALKALAEEIHNAQYRDLCESKSVLNGVNRHRCRRLPFVYPDRLLNYASLTKPPLQSEKADWLSTPAHLLALRKSQQERADELSEMIKRFVFAVPKAGAQPPQMSTREVIRSHRKQQLIEEQLLQPLQTRMKPFRLAQARLSSFFPDKKLIQFDAGKLQTLAELLRERKRGGHKILIFTQMQKMLDILEAFLNINGHTYLRLDGSTGVDRRQRLMDRFNNDPKIFCFILSTRSGGVGINLTGADTVVFYDSDWNPAQDAQAQDRAHRIGQTRDVHIFRLVTEHTIEENILIKARQKRNLDILVMDQGNFDSSLLEGRGKLSGATAGPQEVKDVYTTGGLRAILGVDDDEEIEPGKDGEEDQGLSSDQIEKTMTSLEDREDAYALKSTRKEAAEELKEFDETIEYKKDSDAEDEEEANDEQKTETVKQNSEEKELEQEIAAWQENGGMDSAAIEASLLPVERYAMHFHEEIDPYYSIFAVLEYRRKLEAEEAKENEIDIEEIEAQKEAEERRAFADGDLLATNPRPEDLFRQRNLYEREKARLRGSKKRRKLTGEDWELREDALTKQPFWYNIDTGEALWDKPKVLLEIEELQRAYERGWDYLPAKTLVHLMGFLFPFPDRTQCATVCSRWNVGATDISFVRHVYPVEMGAYTRDERKMERNHYRTIQDAVNDSFPGDVIELGDGHYWQNSDLEIKIPLKFVGDEYNPANVVIEMSGSIRWRAAGGYVEGVTFRKPKLSSHQENCNPLLLVESTGSFGMIQSAFDNEGGSGATIEVLGEGKKGFWEKVSIQHGQHGLIVRNGAILELSGCHITRTKESGIFCTYSVDLKLQQCTVEKNCGNGVTLVNKSRAYIAQCMIIYNNGLAISKDTSSVTTCTGNSCTKSEKTTVAPPGFQFLTT